MFLLDTSVLVTALTPESSTTEVQDWLMRHRDQPMAIDCLCITEFSAALANKVRNRSLTANQQGDLLQKFREFRQSVQILDLNQGHYFNAANICNRSASNMRAPDALHLAVAWGAQLTLVTRDKQLNAACENLGVSTELLP